MKGPSKHTARKTSARKETWQASRRRYTWHLRQPFAAKFDRSHWWEGQTKIEPSAALYELARRHPLVREAWLRKITAINRNRRGLAIWHPRIRESWHDKIARPYGDPSYPSLPPSLLWTCSLGLKSWANLDWTDRRNWEAGAGNLKGLDFRTQFVQGRCIRVVAHWKIGDKREDAVRDKAKTLMDRHELVRQDLAQNPPTADEWESAIAQCAIEAHRQGYVLLAVAPDLAVDKAEALMAKKYREHLKLYPPLHPHQRARWEDWLPLIAEFEKDEASSAKAKSQVFARYRRALDGIRFA